MQNTWIYLPSKEHENRFFLVSKLKIYTLESNLKLAQRYAGVK